MARNDQKRPALARLWTKVGLDAPSIFSMIKFALAPVISLTIFQSDAVADRYSTVGYLIAVGAVLSSPLAPRATYIEATICNIIFVSMTAALSTFALWTVIKARDMTSSYQVNGQSYNSSASAVSGIWLFFMLYMINSFKFTRPSFKFASVMASIMTMVALTYAPQFLTIHEALDLVKRLYGALMSGIAIASAVSLLVKPTSCRQVCFKDFADYITQLRALMRAERVYMASLELQNPFRNRDEADDVTSKVRALRAIHAKLFADLAPAKKEIAYGRLSAADLSAVQRILRRIFLPVIGISQIISIFERLSVQHGWSRRPSDIETASEHHLSLEYQEIFQSMHSPIEKLHGFLSDAFDHVTFLLKLQGWKQVRDKIAQSGREKTDESSIGGKGFANRFEEEIDNFHQARLEVLRAWCARHNINLAPDSFESNFDWITNDGDTLFGTPVQRQLFIVLYVEFLEWSAARAVLAFVRFADSKIASGTMATKRFILPGQKTMSKWMRTFARSDSAEDSLDSGETLLAGADTTRSLWTDTFKGFRKDPEHLAPTHPLQNVGRYLRAFGSIMRSQHSQFGFRLACAAMSIEIIAYLSATQLFFVEQRLFWAAIMVAVSMTRTSGEASFIYFLRIMGTLLGAVCCYIIWYVVNGHVAGVLIFYFIFVVGFGYVPVKIPRLALAAVIATITCTLVIGYELQVMKIGYGEATTNKQIYYPIYLLAPFRFATTAVGIFVAFVFTIFPFPISEGSEIRRDLGVALYSLASHYALVQETVAANISGQHGDLSLRTSPGRKIERARVKLMARQMLLIQRMRQQSGFTKWQMPLDAPFPKKIYDDLIDLVEEILNFTALTGYAATSFARTEESAGRQNSAWHESFHDLQESVQRTSDEVTSLLSLLSSCILYAQPLPPHLHLPAPYSLLQRMQATNRHILDISHVAERGYAAFAVLQISSRSIIVDLYKLTDLVRELVGELDFSLPYTSTKLSRQETNKRKQF